MVSAKRVRDDLHQPRLHRQHETKMRTNRTRSKLQEIQREELARLFGKMLGARLAILPFVLAPAVWLALSDPVSWHRWLLLGAVAFLSVFFVVEAIRYRCAGFRPGAVALNLSAVLLGHVAITFATGGRSSPFLFLAVPISLLVGVMASPPAANALVTVQLAGLWGSYLAGSTADPGAAASSTAWPAAIGISVALLLGSGTGRSLRKAFEKVVARAVSAQDDLLRVHVERAQELTALSGEIAHELKNPLATIKGLSGLLAENVRDAREGERVRVLRREVDRTLGTLEEFLNFSRPLVPLSTTSVDLAALCHEMAALHEGVARERDVALAVRASRTFVTGDARKLGQILMNLVQNAIEASPRGSVVELEADRRGDGDVSLRVLDRGPGLDESVAGSAFAPGVTTKATGSGLGLTVARALARQHGGDLTLTARQAGGTIAELVLPRGLAAEVPQEVVA